MSTSTLTGHALRSALESCRAGDEEFIALCGQLAEAVICLRAEAGLTPLGWPATVGEVSALLDHFTQRSMHDLIALRRQQGSLTMPEPVRFFVMALANWRSAHELTTDGRGHRQLVEAIGEALTTSLGHSDSGRVAGKSKPSLTILQSRFAPDPVPITNTAPTKRRFWSWRKRGEEAASPALPSIQVEQPVIRPSLLSNVEPNPTTAAIQAGFRRAIRDHRPLLVPVESVEESSGDNSLPHEYVARMEQT